MPLSEELAKLSDSMADLSNKAKDAETRTAQARAMNKEQLEARAAEARVAIEARRDEIEGACGCGPGRDAGELGQPSS